MYVGIITRHLSHLLAELQPLMAVRISFLLKIVVLIMSDAWETATAGETATRFPGHYLCFRKDFQMMQAVNECVDICLNIA